MFVNGSSPMGKLCFHGFQGLGEEIEHLVDLMGFDDQGRAKADRVAHRANDQAVLQRPRVECAADLQRGIEGGLGRGVSDELDIGFFLKRARAAEMTFGGAAYHRDRFARLSGY